VGWSRLVGSAVALLAVLAGAYWLVKPPAATTESTLPYAPHAAASSTTTTPAASADTPSTTAVTAEVVVHVAGAVASSGVYRLPAGSRVVDAVQTAGGLAPDAAPDAVNLAALLTDGQRIYVPRVGEVAPAEPSGGGSTVPSGPVNLNSATADELDALPGVGPATAAAIIAHREQHGPFGSVDDLADVRGIGPAKVEALRGLVTT
jgi:competence protein ComEA